MKGKKKYEGQPKTVPFKEPCTVRLPLGARDGISTNMMVLNRHVQRDPAFP